MSETGLVQYNDGNVVKFSHYIKYKNPNYIKLHCTHFFMGLVLGEKPPVYFFLFGIFEILAPNQHFCCKTAGLSRQRPLQWYVFTIKLA